jgi:hypothetical protein
VCTLSTQSLEAQHAGCMTYDAAQPSTTQRRSGLESFSVRKTSQGVSLPVTGSNRIAPEARADRDQNRQTPHARARADAMQTQCRLLAG